MAPCCSSDGEEDPFHQLLSERLEESPLLPLLNVEEGEGNMVEEASLDLDGWLVLGIDLDLLVHELTIDREEEGYACQHVRRAC